MSEVVAYEMARGDFVIINGRRNYYNDQYKDELIYNRVAGAKASLMTRHPFWGFLALDLTLVEAPNDQINTMATDGYHIFYSKEFVEQLTQEQILFVIAHEVYHCLLGHTGGKGKINRMRKEDGYHQRLANKAQDFVINYDLVDSNIGEFISKFKIRRGDEWIEAEPCYDTQFADMHSEEVYEYLLQTGDYENMDTLDVHIEIEIVPDGTPIDNDGDCEGGSQSGDGHENMKIRMTESDFAKEAHRWQQIGQRAVAAARNDGSGGAGSIPSQLQRLLGDMHKTKIPWNVFLRRFVNKFRSTGYSFQRPDKKTFGGGFTLPSFRRDQDILKIAVAIDTSGSVGDEALSKFVSELFGILKGFARYEVHAFCFEGDVDPSTYMVIKGSDRDAKKQLMKYAQHVKGGGGTLFQSVWDFMREKGIKPRGLVLFTDGYPCDAGWHKEAKYTPAMFVTVGNENNWVAPFGKTVAYEQM